MKLAYDGAVERINNQTDNKRAWARRVLAWVFHARRLLTPDELQHALAVRPDDRCINRKNFVSLAEVVSLCAGLVEIGEKGTVVRLVHYTTKEYLENHVDRNNLLHWIRPKEEELARSCLTYLTFDSFASGQSENPYHHRPRITEHMLLRYAARYWGEHIRCFQEQLSRDSHLLLRDDGLTTCASQALALQTTRFNTFAAFSSVKYCMYNPGWHGLHLTALFDLDVLFRSLINDFKRQDGGKCDLNAKDRYNGTTVLSLAAENGHEGIVKMLIGLGQERVDLTQRDGYGMTAAFYASGYGHEGIVKMLGGPSKYVIRAS